ncbi:E3 ubiquitin-protein ligase DTX3L [Oopsacas minuta]|uniref:RING-type E3 ubiquitin transferase n=1 Tax=Oopsacas minuta TaxID=111878 RepID=A0AAV7JSL2_9METZ|nr:E3 ubiquitin-protein ligase DTX3L [Oopsacas minuta]
MAGEQFDASNGSLLQFNEEDTQYILQHLDKINSNLKQEFCSTSFLQDSDRIRLSSHTQQQYNDSMRILANYFKLHLGRELSEQISPGSICANIELDQHNHQILTSTQNMDQLNNILAERFSNSVDVSPATGYNLRIQAPDLNVLQLAFNFIHSSLQDWHNKNEFSSSPNTPQSPSPSPSTKPVRNIQHSCSTIEMKKWIIPESLYELSKPRIESIFGENDCDYSIEFTSTGNVIIEYGDSSSVVERIKIQLESIRKQFQALTQQKNTPTYQTQPDSPSKILGHFSYQDETADSPPSSSTSSQTKVIQPSGPIGTFPSNLPVTNPFFEDLNPSLVKPDSQNNSNETSQPFNIQTTQNSIPSHKPINPSSLISDQDRLKIPFRETDPILVHINSEPSAPSTLAKLDNFPNESHYSTKSTISTNNIQDNSSKYSQSQPRDKQTNSTTSNRNKTRDNSLSDAMRQKKPPMLRMSGLVATSKFNDPQLVEAESFSHEYQHPSDRYSDPPQEDLHSHQSKEAIIHFDNKYGCVVRLEKYEWHEQAKFLEQTLLGLKVIRCPNQPQVCTLVSDKKEMVKCGLKELHKKFGSLGYLPALNGIPIMTAAIDCVVELDDKPKQSKKVKILASLTCTSGLNIKINFMSFTEGSWDVVVKSVEQSMINSTRQNNIDILDVVGPGTRPEEGRHLVKRATKLDYWYFYLTENSEPLSKHIIHVVIPDWNPNEFNPNNLKQSIVSILNYCNSYGIQSIAFPIIGHESKKIPIPLSAQALLQAIDEFSSQNQSPNLKQVDIVITKESCIRAFQYHFITPIQRHLKMSSDTRKDVTSEEEEETCPICLEALHSDGIPIRKLIQCKHEFHEPCISKAIETKPRCPLCMSPLGVQRGNQPAGGLMTHSTLFYPLPGYPNHGTIKIHYQIPSGVQNKSHPNPGTYYPSTSRTAYLPANQKGLKVLGLLRVAFERGLIFTVGTSRTLGMDNMITWNDIHHKTMQTGSAYGYPDDSYLDRVIAELKDKGVE